MVYQEYPDGDMAPKAYYMAITLSESELEQIQLLEKLIYNHPNHSIIDDALYNNLWSIRSNRTKEFHTFLNRLDNEPPTTDNDLSRCRIELIKGELYFNPSSSQNEKAITYYKNASLCTNFSDIHRNTYLSWVDALLKSGSYSEAQMVIENYKKTYLHDVYNQSQREILFYLRLLNSLAYYANSDDQKEPDIGSSIVCREDGLDYSLESYNAYSIQPHWLKASLRYNSYSYDAMTWNAFTRYYGCLYVLDKISVHELHSLAKIESKADSYDDRVADWKKLRLLLISMKKGDVEGARFYISQVNRHKLNDWQKDQYDKVMEELK